MKLGVDFGTTRIVVAGVDRGNYPLVPFETPEATFEWLPPLVALRDGERRYGWDAWAAQMDPSWTVVRSLKRYLEDAGPETVLEAGGARVRVVELLEGLLLNLREGLEANFGEREKFEVMLGVPANANSNQRFLTVDGFRRAGFTVLGLLNEPSAASIEFGHRQRFSGRLLVYDLGGGTFDASLVELDDKAHTVIATEGISTLGGDDFDRVLGEMALGPEKLATLAPDSLFRLEEECRRQKEALHPNSRRMVVDLDLVEEGLGQTIIAVPDYYERCRPLLDETVAATARLASTSDIDALYITGGGSELPLVARMLRDEFGRKVKRSEYTRSATAIGLAIQADSSSGYELREVFTRNFGVWRESEAGHRMVFDPIFPRGTRLPTSGEHPLTVSRTYYPVHNIGHFRYLEASQVSVDEQPAGDITVWDEILFPFDPALRGGDLHRASVERTLEDSQEVEECYACDAAGVVTATVRNLTSGYGQDYRLGKWSGKEAVVKPKGTKRARKASS
jgi:molecular chaperone DnaK (HSP70)